MTSRQRRLYETAFDSRVKRGGESELDSPVLQGDLFRRQPAVARAASRSSFGSTSGSSASSTPTHQSPMHFTPTERRRVTLMRDLPRSCSPRARLLQWDSASDKSSSQESMNVVEDFRSNKNVIRNNYPNNWKELSADFHHKDEDSPFSAKKNLALKVLPVDNARTNKQPKNKENLESAQNQNQNRDSELKENNADDVRSRRQSRPCSLLSEVRTLDNVPQSPENDHRPSEEYDPPWDFKPNPLRPSVNGSISVPERLSQPNPVQMPSSSTHEKLESENQNPTPQNLPAVVPKALPPKPSGPPSRSNLNLNLNLNSDSPRKARQNLQLNFGCAALSAVGEKVDAELTLEKQGWYHGSISRLDAENLLRVLKEGSYLVRNSESSKQDYSLSLKSARGFMHMKIVHSDGRFILGQFSNPFSSIPEMIHHYSINKLPIKGAEHMSLLYPVIDQLL